MKIDLVGCEFEAEPSPAALLDPNMGAVLSVKIKERYSGGEIGELTLGIREAQDLREALERLTTPCP